MPVCMRRVVHGRLEYLVGRRAQLGTLHLVGAVSMLFKSIEGLTLNLLCLTQLLDLFSPYRHHAKSLRGIQKAPRL